MIPTAHASQKEFRRRGKKVAEMLRMMADLFETGHFNAMVIKEPTRFARAPGHRTRDTFFTEPSPIIPSAYRVTIEYETLQDPSCDD